jgi:hypothetical protein
MKEKLKCIKECDGITVGRIYESINFDYDQRTYTIMDDNDVEVSINQRFFINLDDNRRLINLICSLG